MNKVLFLLFICFLLIGCEDQITNNEYINNYYVINEIPEDANVLPIIYLQTPDQIQYLASDSITIENIQIINNTLVIDANYPESCNYNWVTLYANSGFLESSPVQLPMKLVYNSYSDTCTTLISKRFYFDLKSVAYLYKNCYREDSGTVILTIYDSDSTNYYLPYPEYVF